MVPWYQIVVDLIILGALLLVLIYAPIIRDRALPLFLRIGIPVVAAVLVFGIVHAAVFGQWPLRGQPPEMVTPIAAAPFPSE